jgi:hypothetical protein
VSGHPCVSLIRWHPAPKIFFLVFFFIKQKTSWCFFKCFFGVVFYCFFLLWHPLAPGTRQDAGGVLAAHQKAQGRLKEERRALKALRAQAVDARADAAVEALAELGLPRFVGAVAPARLSPLLLNSVQVSCCAWPLGPSASYSFGG